VVGTATLERQLVVEDTLNHTRPVDMPMPVLLGKPPRMQRSAQRAPAKFPALDTGRIKLEEAAGRVLRLPSVASKNFLITIGDRTVGGLTVRDQMVGPWQVPVADCAVTATAFTATTGEAMSMGERPLLALLDAPASGRMAVGEAITNIAAARIGKLSDVRLSANWMAACGQNDEDARLFDTVRTVGAELCPELGIAIPVGKDSLSMKSVWQQNGETRTQTSPLSVVISAFAPVADVRSSLTPQLRRDAGDTRLLLIDLGNGRNRLGGSALAQVYGEVGDKAPDLDQPQQLKAAFDAVQSLNAAGRVLAYHDRSDGGLYATLCEMAFAGRAGVDVALDGLGGDAAAALFSEELGMVLQVRASDAATVLAQLHAAKLAAHDLGTLSTDDRLRFTQAGREIYAAERETLHKVWAETSTRIAALRDEPDCVREEFDNVGAKDDPGLSIQLSFDSAPHASRLTSHAARRPRVAILREQGVNGQTEMAWAFDAAGFESVDVHMTDVLSGRVQLGDFAGLVACGGFSYGDVLGAGQGWAKTILFNARARDGFQAFLTNKDKFALGVCNGCQMFAALKDIVPGAQHWPAFRRNRSEQFEARWTMVEVVESRSLFLTGMEGSRLPIAVAHGEGRAVFSGENDLDAMVDAQQVGLTFIDNHGNVAESYPQNPNGSPAGLTGICNDDGRVTIMMPHPERTIAGVTGSYWPQPNGEFTPWMQMFRNARKWVG
jgi:phosphoribosylformylglycinamidine synthase